MKGLVAFLLLVMIYLTSMVCYAKESVQFDVILDEDILNGQEGIGVVRSIAEDGRGLMWFGGEKGLARFDGHSWVDYRSNIKSADGLPSSAINDLDVDLDGRLWIATEAGLVSFDSDTNQFNRISLNDKVHQVLLSQVVTCLAVDRFSNLLLGTPNGLLLINKDRKRSLHFTATGDSSGLSGDFIREITVDSKNRIWIATDNQGLNLYDRVTQEFKHFLHDSNDSQSLVGNNVRSVMEDDQGRIWVGTFGNGVSVLNEHGKVIRNYQNRSEDRSLLQGMIVWDILQDKDNAIWLATDHAGVALFNPKTGSFDHTVSRHSDSNGLVSSTVLELYEDRRGDIWISTFPYGISLYDRSKSVFKNFKAQPEAETSLSHDGVLSLTSKDQRHLWIGTEYGLNLFDQRHQAFLDLPFKESIKEDLNDDTILDMVYDQKGNLWIATWSEGLKRISPDEQNIQTYHGADTGLPSKFIWRLYVDVSGVLWVGTENAGLFKYDETQNKFEKIRFLSKQPETIGHKNVRALFEDSQGRFWIGTYDGLDIYDRKTGKVQDIYLNEREANGGSISQISTLAEDGTQRIWIGTYNNGLTIYNLDTQSFDTLTKEDGLPSNRVTSITFDLEGNAWVATTHGVARIEKGNLNITMYHREHGLVGNNFNRDASYTDEKGYLYFGSSEGLSIWHPNQIITHIENPKVAIIDVTTPNPRGIYDPLPGMFRNRHVSVPNTQNTFKVRYSLLDFRSPETTQYEYKLDGFNAQWIKTGNVNQTTFTNLPSGYYVFQVRASNRDGIWSQTHSELGITVLPKWWQSWWVICIYTSVLLLILFVIWRWQIRVVVAEKDKETQKKLQELDKIKDAVLSNTSHELRSPLNRIIGLAESMADGALGSINSLIQEYLRVLILNAKQLVYVVDDILEYSALTGNIIAINKTSVEIHGLVEATYSSLASLAQKQKVHLINDINETGLFVSADEDRLQQIISNLVSTSLRHTQNGRIRVSSSEHDNIIELHIEDTGQSMSQETINAVFAPFHLGLSIDASDDVGPNLGLAMTKHLIELHGGTFEVEPLQGEGNRFIVALPESDQMALTSLPTRATPPSLKGIGGLDQGASVELDHLTGLVGGPENYSIMIVDDDPVTRMLIGKVLSDFKFNTIEVASGEQALAELSAGCKVHLVLLDVVMPEVGGYQVCEKIRQVWGFNALPVIFLSAKRAYDDILKGVLVGGNDFLVKPVSKHELIPRIVNQLRKT